MHFTQNRIPQTFCKVHVADLFSVSTNFLSLYHFYCAMTMLLQLPGRQYDQRRCSRQWQHHPVERRHEFRL